MMTDIFDEWMEQDTEQDVEQSIFAGMEIETELDIQASKILVTIHDGDKQWTMEYPAKGVDKNAGKVFGDIDYGSISIDRDEVEDPVGEEFIHSMVTKRMKQEGRILSQEEKGDVFHEIEITLMDTIDNAFELMEA
jgi:hypothetical protein